MFQEGPASALAAGLLCPLLVASTKEICHERVLSLPVFVFDDVYGNWNSALSIELALAT